MRQKYADLIERDALRAEAAAGLSQVLHDGDSVELGGTKLVAHLTPGHTKGCTTWTLKATEDGKTYDVTIVGSANGQRIRVST